MPIRPDREIWMVEQAISLFAFQQLTVEETNAIKYAINDSNLERVVMANLLVRNIEDKIVQALKQRAGRENISAEALHRNILKEALLSRRKSFAEVLAAMPDIGSDSDFSRVAEPGRSRVSG